MRLGAMEIEYVIRLIIMLVVVAVVIMLIWTFYDETQIWWCNLMGTCGGTTDAKTEVIKQSLFTTTDVAKYIDSCWMMTGEDYSGDFICYVLQGSFEVEPDSIAPLLRSFPADRLTVQMDFRGESAVIQFKDIGNEIVVS